MGHKPWDRPSKRIEKAKAKRAWEAEVDVEVGAVYVSLHNRPVKRTVGVGYGVMVDEDADGNPVGIEVLGSSTTTNVTGHVAATAFPTGQ